MDRIPRLAPRRQRLTHTVGSSRQNACARSWGPKEVVGGQGHVGPQHDTRVGRAISPEARSDELPRGGADGGFESGSTQLARSKSRNSSASSCGVSFAAPQLPGMLRPPFSPLTWMSLNVARPHCSAGGAPAGTSKLGYAVFAGLSV